MWPWSHLVVGYVTYSLWCRISTRAPPTEIATLCCVFGTQFPDLVDKPLAWSFGVIPNGRSLAHSALSATLVLVIALCYAYWRGHRREYVAAFGIGYYSHLFGDALSPLLDGSTRGLFFLLWPILSPIEYPDRGFVALLAQLEPLRLFVTLVFLFPAVLLWLWDGTPGTAPLRWVRDRVTSR